MPKNPDSPKKKARLAKKHIVNFSPDNETLTIEINGVWHEYYNAVKIQELIAKAKEGRESDNQVEIVTICNACGVENGHSEDCELNKKELVN